jgi:predicted ester cyclase
VSDQPTRNKALIAKYCAAMYDFSKDGVRNAMNEVFAPEAVIHHCFPFKDMCGPGEFYNNVFAGLHLAWPDIERRDYILTAGPTSEGNHWVGCAGYYTGTFINPWLDIPPTGHMIAMRFHEFYRIENGQVVEFQGLWDIADVMRQAKAWPLAPSLGHEWHVPGPATQDGLVGGPYDETKSAASCQHVMDMLAAMNRHPAEGGPELMEMEKYWHQKMSWYGPSGIGTCRGIDGFRNWHQIPFLNASPDRGQRGDDVVYHFFADGDYVGVTGWPNMIQTLSDGGWMGIAPAGKTVSLRSLDFWRVENSKIRENWVLVDMLDMYDQIGVDVFARLREFNKSRSFFGNDRYIGAQK